MAFEEIISGPFEIWTAPVNTAFPAPGAAPGVGWARLGAQGDASQARGGVTVRHDGSLNLVVPAGRGQPGHAFTPSRTLTVRFELNDLSPETYAAALGNVAVQTPNADQLGNLDLSIGLSPDERAAPIVALLVRGPSPKTAGQNAQYEIARAAIAGKPGPVFQRGRAAALAFEFTALRNPVALRAEEAFGRLVVRQIVPPPPLSLSPGADWDGTAASGFATTPSDPPRTTAKPVCRPLEPDWQQFDDELVVGVSAWALNNGTLIGGIDRVRFHLEGATVDVLEPTLRQFSNADGTTYWVLGYWVTIKRPTGAQQTGELNLYIEAIPADSLMQNRVIGPYSYSIVDTLYPIDVTVEPSQAEITGQRYQTIQAAWDYVTTNSNDFGRVLVTEAGTYEGLKVSGLPYEGSPVGRVVLEATAPVTIGFATYAGDPGSEFDSRHPMHARGSNITFDMANISHFEHDNRPGRTHWFDQVKFIDSAAGVQRLGLRFTPAITEGAAWFTGCDVRGCYQPYRSAELVRGGTTIGGAGDVFPEALCVVDHTINGWNNTPFWEEKLAGTITGPANSTLSLSGGNNASSRTLTAKVSGSTVGTPFAISGTSAAWDADTNYTVENVADWVNNTLPSGWSFVADTAAGDPHPRRANLLGRKSPADGSTYYKGTAFTDVDCSAGLELVTTGDIHSDLMAYNANGENIVFHNVQASGMQSQLLLLARTSGLEDMFLVNVAAQNGALYPGYTGYASQFARTHSNVVIAHCSLPNQAIIFQVDNNYNPDPYSAILNCAVSSITSTSTFDTDLTIANCVIDSGETVPSTATGTVATGTAASKFADAGKGDFTPIVELLANLKAPVVSQDANASERAASDAVGAVKA
ncbi:MAG: hypothetical protein AAFZ11_01040 [Pseudomonadota bacterium]